MAEEKKGTPVEKWDEVNGRDDTTESGMHDTGALGSQMRSIEDAVEQNDNSFDGIINNLPKPEETVKEELTKKSVLKELKERVASMDEEKVKLPKMHCHEPERS